MGDGKMEPIKNILVPTDCSELSKDAVTVALQFAHTFNANITLLMVSNQVPIIGFEDSRYLPEYISQQLMEESDQYDKSKIEQFWKEIDHKEVKPRLVVLKGDPFTHIIKFATEASMDLIVMGTHGHTGLQHVLMGSVAEKVVRYSPVPIITVKQPQHPYTPV